MTKVILMYVEFDKYIILQYKANEFSLLKDKRWENRQFRTRL